MKRMKFAALAAGVIARVAKSIWRRADRPGREVLNLPAFVLVGMILLTIDRATFVGWVDEVEAFWSARCASDSAVAISPTVW